MTYEETQEWLKTLKTGDKVCYLTKANNIWNRFSYYKYLEVKNITKSGNIRLENGDLIKIGGLSPDIEPITENVKKYNQQVKIKIKLEEKLSKTNVFNLPIEKVIKILKVLESEELNKCDTMQE